MRLEFKLLGDLGVNWCICAKPSYQAFEDVNCVSLYINCLNLKFFYGAIYIKMVNSAWENPTFDDRC